MDFTLSPEQKLLQESAERFLTKEYPFEVRRRLAGTDEGFRRDSWKTFAELGWLGVGIPEKFGGSGGSAVETAVLMEAFGRALVAEPYLTTVVLGCGALRLGGTEEQKQALLPAAAAGDLLLAFAFTEAGARYDPAHITPTAKKNGAGFVLNGQKSVVFNAATADRIIIPARTGGGRRDAKGITLFLVESGAPGLTRRDYATVDGLRASEVTLGDVAVGSDAVIGETDGALPLIRRVMDLGVAAVAAEAVGIMQALNDATLEYLKIRRQFGRPIGEFQALQHRVVDMYMAYELSKSMAYMAAVEADGEDADGRGRAVSAAKVQIGRAGRLIGQEAVQLHGGMGMTDELPVGHYFKRLTMIDTLFGNTDYHLGRFAEVSAKPREG